MLNYSKTSIFYPSGQRKTCCLSIQLSMLLTKKRNVSYPAILLNNDPLEYVQQYKYLGVIVSHCWSQHIQEVCNKARKVLGIIYCNISSHTNDPSTIFRLYVALVQPHLEYAAQVWNPHLYTLLRKIPEICSMDLH